MATIDTCALPSVTQFCDEDGYDIVPIRVVTLVYTIEPTCEDASLDEKGRHLEFEQESSEKEFTYYSKEEFSDDDAIVSKETLKKAELNHKLEWVSETHRRQIEREKR